MRSQNRARVSAYYRRTAQARCLLGTNRDDSIIALNGDPLRLLDGAGECIIPRRNFADAGIGWRRELGYARIELRADVGFCRADPRYFIEGVLGSSHEFRASRRSWLAGSSTRDLIGLSEIYPTHSNEERDYQESAFHDQNFTLNRRASPESTIVAPVVSCQTPSQARCSVHSVGAGLLLGHRMVSGQYQTQKCVARHVEKSTLLRST